jgi:demethylspheroidene O-methyltransferase
MVGNEALAALVEHHALVYEDLEDPVALFAGSARATRMSTLWPYAVTDDPRSLVSDDVANYTALMAASQTMVAEQVVDTFSFRGRESLLDIGGGAAAFGMAVARRWPAISVTVADLPAVADLAARAIESEGLSDRVAVVGADATAGELPAGFDVVSLVRILHDHDDDRALAMLRAARAALAPGGTLLIAEPIAGADAAGALIDAYFEVYLLAMGSGRPRTVSELSRLARAAGFGPIRRHRAPVSLVTSVLSAQPDS